MKMGASVAMGTHSVQSLHNLNEFREETFWNIKGGDNNVYLYIVVVLNIDVIYKKIH